MPNFTSSFISTADIGEWDYYIFSDNTAIWRSLNGLAAWFDGSGAMLQGAAWLGALLLLGTALFGGAVRKPSVSAGTIGVWFFFMVMMGITGQANIYNIYTNQVTVVKNVPALALVPASVFSKAAYRVFTSMDTSFQSVNGSYMTVSENGFIGPLEILLALRSPQFANARPGLSQTLSQVVHDCSQDLDAAVATSELYKSQDILQWLVQNGRKTGLTRIYSEADVNGAGTIMSCADALQHLDDQYTSIAGVTGDSTLVSFINSQTTRKNPQDPKGLWNSASIDNSYQMLVGAAVGVTQSALQFTKNALVASSVNYAINCLDQQGSLTSAETCTSGAIAMADNRERWKIDSAVAGSSFLKTMFTSMGVMQALFFALFPIIAIYGLVVPNKAPTVFGGFVFFGIWCQSWLLTVAPVQSYVQTAVVDEVTKILASGGGMTLANTSALYETLSTKLAVAGDIMASSQMLSLALLSGSVYALSGVAQRWTGVQNADGSMLQNKLGAAPDITKSNAINTVDAIAMKNGTSVHQVSGYGAGAASLTTTLNNTGSASSTRSDTFTSTVSRGKELAAHVKAATGYQMSEEESFQYASAVNSNYGVNARLSTAIIGDVVGALGKMGNMQANAAIEAAAKNAGGGEQKGGSMKGLDAALAGQITQTDVRTDSAAVKKSLSFNGDAGAANSDKLNDLVSRAKAEGRTFANSKSAVNGIQMSLEPANIMRLGIHGENEHSGPQLMANASRTATRLMASDKFSDLEKQNAEQWAENAMMGRRISNPDIADFQRNLYLIHSLNGGHIDGLYTNQSGIDVGAGSVASNPNLAGKEAYEGAHLGAVSRGGVGRGLQSKQFESTVNGVVDGARARYEGVMDSTQSPATRLHSTESGARLRDEFDSNRIRTGVGILGAAAGSAVGNLVLSGVNLLPGAKRGLDADVPSTPWPKGKSPTE